MKVTIPAAQHDKVKAYAKQAEITQGQVIEMILDDYFYGFTIADTLKKMIEMGEEDATGSETNRPDRDDQTSVQTFGRQEH